MCDLMRHFKGFVNKGKRFVANELHQAFVFCRDRRENNEGPIARLLVHM